MNDWEKVPFVDLGADAKEWAVCYQVGERLAEKFPGQDADEFTSACYCNDCPVRAAVTGIVMVKQGEHDGADWVWNVTFADGSKWVATGWCDYTGWDCQSDLQWEPVP